MIPHHHMKGVYLSESALDNHDIMVATHEMIVSNSLITESA